MGMVVGIEKGPAGTEGQLEGKMTTHGLKCRSPCMNIHVWKTRTVHVWSSVASSPSFKSEVDMSVTSYSTSRETAGYFPAGAKCRATAPKSITL